MFKGKVPWLRTSHLLIWGAFLVLAISPVMILGVRWLVVVLGGEAEALSWAIPSGRTRHLLSNSLSLAVCVTVLATFLGTGLAVWLSGAGRLKRIVGAVYLIPLFIPPYIHALEWMAIAGRRQFLDRAFDIIPGGEGIVFSAYGFWPTVIVLTLATFPLVTLLVRSGLAAIEPELLESASLMRTPWPVARRVLLPLIMPSILAGAGLVFVIALVQYGVPSILQYNVYAMEIYASFSQSFDPVRGFAVSMPLLAIAAILLALSQSRLRQTPLRGRTNSRFHLPAAAWPTGSRVLLILVVVIWAVSCLVPIIVLLAHGGTPSVFSDAIPPAWGEIGLTIIVAVISGIIATAISVPLAILMTRRLRGGGAAWLLCALPLAIPGPLVGMSLIYIWNRPMLDFGYGTWLLLVLAHVARFLPFAVYAAASRVRQIDPILLEAASLHDVGWWRRFMRVRLPLLAPAIVVSWLVVFIFSLGEIGASLLVAPPGEATLPMRIYNLLHYSASDAVSALSLTILLVAGLACVGILIVQKRLWRGAA